MVYQRSFYLQRRWEKKPESALRKEDVEKQLKDLPTINFSTWNVEGKGSPEEIDKLLKSGTMKSCPDIVCLQEANLPSAGGDTASYKWLCSGAYGSAVLLKKNIPLKCTAFDRICDQICVADIEGYNVTFKVISCYIPPSTDYLSVDLWTKLKDMLTGFPSNLLFILGGDFNAEIGSEDRSPALVGTVGPGLLHKVSNDHGTKLLKLAISGHYKITSTYYNRAFVHKDDCTFKDGENNHQRDYIIMPFSQFKFFYNGPSNAWRKGYRHAIHSNIFSVKEPTILKHELMVNTWNIEGVSPTKVDGILMEQDLSIVCVQGLFLTSEDDVQSKNFTWYCSKKLWAKNVGIVVKKTDDLSVANFEVISEFLCSMDLTVLKKTVKLICCYLPVSSDPNHETVAKQLSELVKGVDEAKHFILAGDFSTYMSESDLKKLDQNTIFLKGLAAESKLCWKNSLLSFWEKRRNFFVTKINESDRSSPHHFFIPEGWRKEMDITIISTWIATFQNAIVSMFLSPGKPEKAAEVPQTKSFTTTTKNLSEISEVANGEIRRTKIYELVEWDSDNEDQAPNVKVQINCDKRTSEPTADDVKEGAVTSTLSPKDIEAFNDKPPSVDDLKRMLPDFIIFYKPNKWSSAFIQNPSNLLVNSFKENNAGTISFEEIIISDEETDKRKKIICNIKWNGILLEKDEMPGTQRNGTVRKGAVGKLLDKLGQFAYTVKGKRSFYNKGIAPILMGDKKLDGYFTLVKKDKVPTKDDVEKHIDDYFSEKDGYADLAFGPGFSEEELTDIKKYARSKKLRYRYFTHEKDGKTTNYIAVFKAFSPQAIKDRLMEKKEDPKFFLVPPAGKSEKSYMLYLSKYTSDHFKTEARIVSGYTISQSNGTKRKLPVTEKPSAFAPRRNTSHKIEPWSTSTPQAYSAINTRREWMSLHNRGAVKRPYNDEGRSSQIDNLHVDRDGRYSQRSIGNTHLENRRDHYSYGDGNYSQHEIWNTNKANHRDEYSYEEPYSKRGRFMEEDEVVKVDKPEWLRLAPLVVIWPISTNSRTEERPRQVLEENFPVDYVRASRNRLAVVVSLPLRDGTEKKYCLSIADSQRRAAESALREIVKHSTTIKPNPTYLCDGATPNFIRYRVPCQTNPRTYLIVGREDTGPLTLEALRDIFETFQASYNEDVFFDKDEYSYNEKMLLLEEAPNYNLKARHFGDKSGIENHHVCVYKTKSKMTIVEEVLKMKNYHPKYVMITNRLPARMTFNIY